MLHSQLYVLQPALTQRCAEISCTNTTHRRTIQQILLSVMSQELN